ncbi:alpha/beta fold hydrolase [Rhodococcus sp. 077-4]|uniref:alpha/beta fold hydrolase n=1 Tax=Rhodococcus sp. 077-4 TaxID=2789271 RepID=UPI0039F60E27
MSIGFIEVAGRRTRVRLDGDPGSSPVVLLHGIGRSLEDWSEVVLRLSSQHRVISLDLAGSGFSERLATPTDLAGLARAVLQTLDELGETRPVHAIGNSLGGAVAQQLVVEAPDRVASLVLLNSAGFGSEVTPALRLLAVPVLGRFLATHPTKDSIAMTERACYAEAKHATSVRLEHARAVAAEPGTGEVMWETVRSMATLRAGILPTWREQLLRRVAESGTPTLVVWGDRDKILPSRHLEAARRALPEASTYLFKGVGHMPQVERPAELAELALEFLAVAA